MLGNMLIECFDQVIRPMFRQRPGLTFQHNNAHPHVARVTRDFLLTNNINVLPWPAYSPDCNPIEHMWDIFGRWLRKRQRPSRNVQELAVALREE